MLQYRQLIGKSLEEAVVILEEKKIPYDVLRTQGKKDKELLKEPYVVAVRETNKIQIIVSNFLTTIDR